ncbi:P-loop containing nucleoside triphosphate hydrolase protein [Mycena galopus ATCC 62051]|nr:P-loop containing nucleoside triphosphate hydrolase protein [Mycena galopus ATCC 62051]
MAPTTAKAPEAQSAPRWTQFTGGHLESVEKELESLPDLIRAKYSKWMDGAKPFQLECTHVQKLETNVILHAATGSGKTGIAAGPHILPSSAGKVTLMVSPLLSLHAEQTFETEFNLKATAINSSNGGCTKENLEVTSECLVWTKIVAREWQIVMLSPEMLLSHRFIEGVLCKPAFRSQCLSVFIDEVHCISHWGASFCKKYATIGLIRALLPRTTPFIAVTATLTPRVHQDLLTKLQFDPTNYLFCTIGNDRSNVSQVIRTMEHPTNSYWHSDFVVSSTMTKPEDIKKAFLYTDDIKEGGKLTDYLNWQVTEPFRDRNLVRPYNASMSLEYRAHVMKLFKAVVIRVLVCTNTAGMGCNIPDIELIVHWKIPQNLSLWVQWAGRMAHRPGTNRMAVMLVEKSAFKVATLGVDPAVSASQPTRGRSCGPGNGLHGCGGNSGRGGGKALRKDHVETHGVKRGSHSGTNNGVALLDTLNSSAEIPQDAPAEGLYALIQATICRLPAIICCDICNPKLFDKVRPPKPVCATRQKGIRKGPPVDSVQQALFTWQRNIKKMHFPHAMFAPHTILNDDTCETLASIGPIENISKLQQQLQLCWSRWDEFGVHLFVFMKGLDIPALPPPPARKKAPPAAEYMPVVSTSAPFPPPIQTPELLSQATVLTKHQDPVHNTPADVAAPPKRRRGWPKSTTTPSSFSYCPSSHRLVSVHGPPDLYAPQMWQDQGRRSQPDLAGGSTQPHFDPNWDGTTRTS